MKPLRRARVQAKVRKAHRERHAKPTSGLDQRRDGGCSFSHRLHRGARCIHSAGLGGANGVHGCRCGMGSSGCSGGPRRLWFAMDHRDPLRTLHRWTNALQQHEVPVGRYFVENAVGQIDAVDRTRTGHSKGGRRAARARHLRPVGAWKNVREIALTSGGPPQNPLRRIARPTLSAQGKRGFRRATSHVAACLCCNSGFDSGLGWPQGLRLVPPAWPGLVAEHWWRPARLAWPWVAFQEAARWTTLRIRCGGGSSARSKPTLGCAIENCRTHLARPTGRCVIISTCFKAVRA